MQQHQTIPHAMGRGPRDQCPPGPMSSGMVNEAAAGACNQMASQPSLMEQAMKIDEKLMAAKGTLQHVLERVAGPGPNECVGGRPVRAANLENLLGELRDLACDVLCLSRAVAERVCN